MMWVCVEPNIDEIRQVIFSIDPDSALGSDKFCIRLYQLCWDIIYSDLLDAVLNYFKGSAMPNDF